MNKESTWTTLRLRNRFIGGMRRLLRREGALNFAESMVILLGLVTVFFGAPATAFAQNLGAASDQLEVLGLHRWTESMLADSVAKYRPGTTLHDAACALVLRENLKFADAAVWKFGGSGEVVIVVIEPGDSQTVRPRAFDTAVHLGLRSWSAFGSGWKGDDWFLVGLAASERIRSTQRRAGMKPVRAAERQPVVLSAQDSARLHEFDEFMRSQATKKDLASALVAIRSSQDTTLRTAAVVVLSNFFDSDKAWWALIDAFRDPNSGVRGTASSVLRAFRDHAARPVDWSPAAKSVRAVVAGTGLMFHLEAIRTLTATSVSPTLARTLLGNSGSIVLAELGSRNDYVQTSAHDFMVALSGKDRGKDPQVWGQWVATLGR